MKVLVLHTLPPEQAVDRSVDEFDLSAAAAGVAEALPGAVVAGVHGEPGEVFALLRRERPDVVWNACEAPLGRPDLEAHVAAMLEWMRIPFTGCGSETLALCRRKDRANAVLREAGVPVPRPEVFPCIIKPADQDGSAFLDADCVCADHAALERVRRRFRGPVVVQEYLPGREFIVALWGHASPDYFSVAENTFEGGLRLVTYAAKWDLESDDFANTGLDYDCQIEPALRASLVCTARRAWAAVSARGYARVDLRLDSAGRPFVLEVNPNPEIGPGVGIHRGVTEAGWSWEWFVGLQVEWALSWR
jgi:D-alanine-D-alanine ligase